MTTNAAPATTDLYGDAVEILSFLGFDPIECLDDAPAWMEERYDAGLVTASGMFLMVKIDLGDERIRLFVMNDRGVEYADHLSFVIGASDSIGMKLLAGAVTGMTS